MRRYLLYVTCYLTTFPRITERGLPTLIPCPCVVCVVYRDIWKLFAAKLAPLTGQSAGYAGPKAEEKDVLSLLKFYEEMSVEVLIQLQLDPTHTTMNCSYSSLTHL